MISDDNTKKGKQKSNKPLEQRFGMFEPNKVRKAVEAMKQRSILGPVSQNEDSCCKKEAEGALSQASLVKTLENQFFGEVQNQSNNFMDELMAMNEGLILDQEDDSLYTDESLKDME